MSAVRHLLNRLRDRGRMLAGEPFFDCRMSAAQLELLDQFGIDPGLGLRASVSRSSCASS